MEELKIDTAKKQNLLQMTYRAKHSMGSEGIRSHKAAGIKSSEKKEGGLVDIYKQNREQHKKPLSTDFFLVSQLRSVIQTPTKPKGTPKKKKYLPASRRITSK